RSAKAGKRKNRQALFARWSLNHKKSPQIPLNLRAVFLLIYTQGSNCNGGVGTKFALQKGEQSREKISRCA
ncbi:MAG: hypothetical protein RSD32_05215, partial [Oscillospiraceae bacterium]